MDLNQSDSFAPVKVKAISRKMRKEYYCKLGISERVYDFCAVIEDSLKERFEVMDRIRLSYQAPEQIEEVFNEFSDEIGRDVLAVSIQKGELFGYQKEWNINGKMVILAVEKVKEQ